MENLTFKITSTFTQSYRIATKSIELGDRAASVTIPVGRSIEESWQVSTPPLNLAQWGALTGLLKQIAGRDFTWRPTNNDDLLVWRCRNWQEIKLNPDYYTISLDLVRAQTQDIDECLGLSTLSSTGAALFPLMAFSYDSVNTFEQKLHEKQIDGGVNATASYTYNATKDSWQVSRIISHAERASVLAFLTAQCGRPFEFRVSADAATGRLYSCFEWSFAHIDSSDYWQFRGAFVRSLSPFKSSPFNALLGNFDFYNDKASIVAAVSADFDDLTTWIADAKLFTQTYTRNTLPLLINTIGLIVNSFHTVLGRGGYFPGSAGPTEAQAVLARSALYTYQITGDTYWRDLGLLACDALLDNFYTLPIPANWTPADGIRVPHWLINIKSPFPTKGAIADDPLNYGFFDLVLTFTNGVATIPAGSPHFGNLLANVYRVYPATDQLLWQNVYAFPLGGVSYAINYWVTDVMLEGVVSRQYPDSESNVGTLPTPTSETTGKIVLQDTSFNGQAKVVYSAYNPSIPIAVNELFEAYPMWRKLRPSEALAAFDVFPWSEDAFDLAYQETGIAKYLIAKNCTIYSEGVTAQVSNPSRWFEKSNALNPFAFPGSQIILANHQAGNQAVTTRVVGGAMDQWISAQIPVSALPFPSAEYQNFAVQIKAVEGMQVIVSAACNVENEIQIVLSLARNPFDFSLYYVAYMNLQTGMIPAQKTFVMDDFLFWDSSRTSWHPHIADDPIYTYQGGSGSSVAINRQSMPIGLFNRYVWRLQMRTGSSFAGAGLVMLGKPATFPLEIVYRNMGGGARLKVTADGQDYYYTLPTTDWIAAKISSTNFAGPGNAPPRSAAIVTKIEVQAMTNTLTDFAVWHVGYRPLTLQLPIQTYKAAIVSRLTTAHTLNIGQFEAIGSPSSQLKYNPGVVPFTCNVVSDGSGGQSIDSWRGAPYSGYQYPAWYVKMGYWARLDQVLDFLLEAQEQYAAQNENGTKGPFMPVFYWGYWDAGDLSPNGVDVWSYTGSDPNTAWCGYYSRPLESAAHAWYRLVKDEYPGVPPGNLNNLIAKAKQITMQYLWWLSSYYTRRNSIQPPTNFPPITDPTVNYHEPHQAAFYLRAAIYANLAGGDPATTIRLIKASLDYMKSQRITNGVMKGSFAAGQPDFPTGGGFKEWFGFWHFEILESLALLEREKNQLIYPDCVYFIR